MNNKYGPAPKSMGFGQSIGTCLKKYAVFEGRASKSEFWPFFLIYVIASVILDFSFAATQSFVIGICHVIVSLGGGLPMLAASCRRLHDVNKSGWFQIIPIYNLILWAQDSSEGTSVVKSSQNRNYIKSSYLKSEKKDLTDDLEELQELYEDGTLSEAQFKKAKKKLLR